MIPRFIINKIKYQANSEEVDNVFNESVLSSICTKLTGQSQFEVVWKNEKNEGRLAILETNKKNFYICISGADPQSGRNSYYQSVPTALRHFLFSVKTSNDEFIVCVQGKKDSHLTKYQMFFSRMILTAGFRIIEVTSGLYTQWKIAPYTHVQDLILARNESKEKNSGNNSTFITDEGKYYHLYGKTFGANGKETTMLCYALLKLSIKPIRLFQILDNGEKTISGEDEKALNCFSTLFACKGITILDDTYEIDEFTSQVYKPKDKNSLRSERFIYNLLQKTNGLKKCALCDCEVQPLIQAAHIYGVAEIKANENLQDLEKRKMALDGNNGLWLCMHHHKLFDSYQIYISLRNIGILSTIDDKQNFNYIKSSITKNKLDAIYDCPDTENYFKYRENAKEEIQKWCSGEKSHTQLQDYYKLNPVYNSSLAANPQEPYGSK